VTFSQCKKCQFCSPSGGWACEYHTRDSISEGLYDAADDDIVIVADLDEVVSEDYLFALKRCEAFPRLKTSSGLAKVGNCEYLGGATLAFSYYFGCMRYEHHWHPDITSGICVQRKGVNSRCGVTTSVLRQPRLKAASKGCPKRQDYRYPPRGVFSGWHLRSFLPMEQYRFKITSFSEDMFNTYLTNSAKSVRERMARCEDMVAPTQIHTKERKYRLFYIDPLKILHRLPKLVREDPLQFRHFLRFQEVWSTKFSRHMSVSVKCKPLSKFRLIKLDHILSTSTTELRATSAIKKQCIFCGGYFCNGTSGFVA